MAKYKGPSFRTVFIDKKAPKNPKLRELIFWGKIFSDLNLAPSYGKGSHGNLSFRHFGGCIITATLTNLKRLKESDFVEIIDCRRKGGEMTVFCKGVLKPSTDSVIHFLIYQARRDVNSVFHGHDTVVLEKVDQLNIAQTAKERPSGSYELFREIKKVLGRRNYLVVKKHGILSFGRTNKQAGERALKVHELGTKKPD